MYLIIYLLFIKLNENGNATKIKTLLILCQLM